LYLLAELANHLRKLQRGRHPFSSSLLCCASANSVSKKEAMSSAGRKN